MLIVPVGFRPIDSVCGCDPIRARMGNSHAPASAACRELDTRLDTRRTAPEKRIRGDPGRWPALRSHHPVRSVKRQEPPYQPLADVAKSQSVWTHGEVSGTLVGIRCPPWVKGLNVPGYHWHFLSDDRKIGGHVLDCRARELKVRYDVCRDWLIKLDASTEFNSANLGEDLSQDLRRVESSRGESPGRQGSGARAIKVAGRRGSEWVSPRAPILTRSPSGPICHGGLREVRGTPRAPHARPA